MGVIKAEPQDKQVCVRPLYKKQEERVSAEARLNTYITNQAIS
jgi:hypothetical protein